MKVSWEELQVLTVRQATMARLLSLTPARVHQLIEEKIVVRNEGDKTGGVYLVSSLQNYYLSKSKSDIAGDESTYWTEKKLHESAKRQLAELKLSRERGLVYDAAAIETALTEELSMLRSRLMGLGMKLSKELEMKPAAEISQILDAEIEESLKELSDAAGLKAKADLG